MKVKVNLFFAPHEDVWKNGGRKSLILKIDTQWI